MGTGEPILLISISILNLNGGGMKSTVDFILMVVRDFLVVLVRNYGSKISVRNLIL
jgi:hypothetical protein